MLFRAWLPFLSLVLQITVALTGANWIDTSSRFPESAGFGFAFGVFIAAFLYASWPTVITFLLGIAATVAPDRRAGLAIGAAVVAAIWGVVVGGYGASEMLGHGDEADRAFGTVLVVAGLCSVVPLVLVPRRRATS